MYDYREWCRLCGSLQGTNEISSDALVLLETLHLKLYLKKQISSDCIKICMRCNQQLENTNRMVESAKRLERLYNGLMEENYPELTLARLNAYRAHFNLQPIIPEVFEVVKSDDKQETHDSEYSEYKYEETGEEIVTESLEGESSLIIQEDFVVEEEIYLEQLDEDSEVIEYSHDDPDEVSQKRKNHSSSNRKTEEEKLFCFSCHICSNLEFQNMKALAGHCKEFHNCMPQVKCCSDECDSVLSTWRRLMIHKEKHFPNDDKLRCPQCQKVYITAAGLEKHIEKHSIPLICSQCGKNFKDPKTLRWHEETHLKSLDERRNHQCSYCGIKFITKQACDNHIGMKHHKVVNSYCNYPNCDKSFFTKKAYYEHIRNTHGERKFSCEHCSFKAKTKSALKIHSDVHTVGEVYVCDICDAAFSVYRRLKSHMICHSDATPFECQTCYASFKRSKDLKAHSYIHTKERPFNCTFCSRSFANGANARKHKLKDHAEELLQWETEFGVGGRKKLKCYQ